VGPSIRYLDKPPQPRVLGQINGSGFNRRGKPNWGRFQPAFTIRLCLIKGAGRVTEMVTRIKIALPSAFPYQAGFTLLAGRIAKLPP
jgi:hypothetical protein